MKKILFTALLLLIATSAYAINCDTDANSDHDISCGGTNASTAALARTNLGLDDFHGPLSGYLFPLENDAVTPTIRFGDGDSGFYEQSDDILIVGLAGAAKARFDTSWLIKGINTNSAGILLANPSTTQPTIMPNNSDADTGVGHGAADQLSLIAGGVEGLRITETAGDILLTTPGSFDHGEMFISAQDVVTINITAQLHALDGFSTGEVQNATFDAGSLGTGNITTAAAGAAINIADVGHGLVSGDYATVTSANHEGVSVVTYVDDDNFTLAIAYVGDEACQWQQPSSLTMTNAGRYLQTFTMSGAGAAAAKDFYFAIYHNDTIMPEMQVIRSTSTNYGSMSMTGIHTLAAGDTIFVAMENQTDANNFTIEYANFTITKI